jgi:hypothetical protein
MDLPDELLKFMAILMENNSSASRLMTISMEKIMFYFNHFGVPYLRDVFWGRTEDRTW